MESGAANANGGRATEANPVRLEPVRRGTRSDAGRWWWPRFAFLLSEIARASGDGQRLIPKNIIQYLYIALAIGRMCAYTYAILLQSKRGS